MKTCFLFIAASLIVLAQAPPAVTNETVVAKIDGKDLTLGELRHMLQAYPPAFMQTFQRDPREALRQIFMVRYAATEGDKLHLGDNDPWKEQIEIARMNVVSAAMFNHERNTFPVSVDDVDRYYKLHQSRYEQAAIKIIKIAFKPAATGQLSVEEIAKRALQAEHAGSDRSEADARKLAAELVAKLRAGADFAQVVAQYSDDAESKASGGDFGTVKPTSLYDDNFKKAVFALKPGEISEPVPSGNALYIVRVESKSVQPLDKVREQIMDDIKDAHFREYLTKLQERFAPVIERPELLVQINTDMGQRPASKK